MLLKKKKGVELDPTTIANNIANNAFQTSMDTRVKTPFASSAKKSGKTWKGGKSDDISIIVGKVL